MSQFLADFTPLMGNNYENLSHFDVFGSLITYKILILTSNHSQISYYASKEIIKQNEFRTPAAFQIESF